MGQGTASCELEEAAAVAVGTQLLEKCQLENQASDETDENVCEDRGVKRYTQ